MFKRITGFLCFLLCFCFLMTDLSYAEGTYLGAETGDAINQALVEHNILNAMVSLNVKIPIRYTVRPDSSFTDIDLYATVIQPGPTDKKRPTILIACPYRRETIPLIYIPLISRGYNIVSVDIRGTGSSNGTWTSFDQVEQCDIAHIVDKWIPAQDWSDGKVGMLGPSYLAIIQLLTAGHVERNALTGEPEHLKALIPIVPMSDAYKDIVMHGGDLNLEFIPLWLGGVDLLGSLPSLLNLGDSGTASAEQAQEAYQMQLDHWNYIDTTLSWIVDPANERYTDFFTKKSPMIFWPVKPAGGWNIPVADNNTIPSKLPVFLMSGWFDIFTRGTLNTYQYGLSEHARGDKAMIIGEWYHGSAAMGLGLYSTLNCSLYARWFDWKIKGESDSFMTEYPVLMYVMGEDKWRAEKAWPLPAGRVKDSTLYLTKTRPSSIEDDWFTNQDNNKIFGLEKKANFDGDNPVIYNDPLHLRGAWSRSSTRWMAGIQALPAEISKWYLGLNINKSMYFEDERGDEDTALTFTTEPLTEDVEIVGPLVLTFWAQTSINPWGQAAVDTFIEMLKAAIGIESNLLIDATKRQIVLWIVELNNVFPDGRARNITSGWLNSMHRQYDPSGAYKITNVGSWYEKKEIKEYALDPDYTPFDPFYFGPDRNPTSNTIDQDSYYQYAVELWPTCNVFKAGNRIRVSISNSDFPHLLPILSPSKSTIIIDEDHIAKLDFKVANKNGEGNTWKWIGDNGDLDKYLIHHTDPATSTTDNGSGDNTNGTIGCGSSANASVLRDGNTSSGITDVISFMMLPFALIMLHRTIKRRKIRI